MTTNNRRAVVGLGLASLLVLPEPTGGVEAHDRALLASSYLPEDTSLGALVFEGAGDVTLSALQHAAELGPFAFEGVGDVRLSVELGPFTFDGVGGVELAALEHGADLGAFELEGVGDARLNAPFSWSGPTFWSTDYRLEVDTDRDLSFATALEACAMEVQFEYGILDAYTDAGLPASFGAPAVMQVALANPDGAFLPEATGALFHGLIRPGQLVRLRAQDATGTVTLFIGRLEKLEINSSPNVEQVALLTVTDITDRLLAAEYRPKLLLNARTDEIIQPIFDAGLVPWPYARDFWLLDVSELDTNTTLYEDTLTQFDAGRTTIAYAGDNLDNGQGISAQGMLRDVVAAEAGGRFLYDAALGKYIFHSRAHDTLFDGDIHAFTTDFFLAGAPYLWGDNLINALTVLYQKRTAGNEAEIIWRYSEAFILLPILGSRTFTVRYTDPNNPGMQVSALNVITPVPGVDFTAWDNEDATGDRTARIGVTVRNHGNSATITLYNSDVDDDVYVFGLQLRGQPLTAFTLDSVYYHDPDSIAEYERREPFPLDLRIVEDDEFALDVAKFIVNRCKEPVARFEALSFEAHESATHRSHALRRRIGDQIAVTGDRLGHDVRYVIVGQRHVIDAARGSHVVTWIPAPLTQTQYWRLDDADYSLLDESTRLFL